MVRVGSGQKEEPDQRSGGWRDCLGNSAVTELDCGV